MERMSSCFLGSCQDAVRLVMVEVRSDEVFGRTAAGPIRRERLDVIHVLDTNRPATSVAGFACSVILTENSGL